MKLNELSEKIVKEIENSLVKLGYFSEDVNIFIEAPKDNINGDFSSNIAMKLAKIARKAPVKIAEEIANEINKDNLYINDIKIAPPGFINIYLDKSFLTSIIKEINDLGSEYGNLFLGENEHYNVEYVSVNPTGALHIGHARGASAGDSLSRILKKAGFKVTREYYVNDAGNQIHNLVLSIQSRYKQLFENDFEMPKDGYHGPEIIEAAKNLKKLYNDRFLHEDGYEVIKKFGVDSLLEILKKDLSDFRVEFDVWFSEKSLYDNRLVLKTIEYLKENDFTYEKDGALWLKTSDYEDEKDRVILKSDGTFTYLTPDIAYHQDKLRRGYTKLIDILGGDHHGYINRLKAAIEMFGGQRDTLEVEILQMVKVIQDGKEIKMSKRSGKAITLRDIIDEVGVDPVRYFFAMRSLNTHMDLDLDLALKQTNENPVYYAQYAHARINSIFNQAKEKGIDISNLPNEFFNLKSDKTFELIQLLANYSDVIKQAAINRAPHKVTNYINALASTFHSFYNDQYVLTDDKIKTLELLSLLKATKTVLKDALSLVGVSAPDKM